MTNKHEVITFGCRLNAFESEIIKDNLNQKLEKEEVIVFNTCAVTHEAERQALQAIRKTIAEHPHKKIIVTGCAAQLKPEKFALDGVTKVIGNEEKLHPEFYDLNQEKILVNDIMSIKETASHIISGFDARTRAFIQVQNGCNHRCTFCTIPLARGNSRSVPIGVIVNQVKSLCEKGYREIVLTGVDISDYGSDLPGTPNLGEMIKRLLSLVPELPRLRISSIDVAEIDENLFNLIAHEKRIMPHLHISLQAGDNMILKRMKRRHNREQVIEFCHKIRVLRPDIAFGADIIAGFPTESDEMFENTHRLIEEADLQFLHIFPYSKRDETPAARMPQVNGKVIKERAAILRSAGEKNLAKFMDKMIGTRAQVLIEENNIGRTENFLQVKFSENFDPGTMLDTEIIARNGQMLEAKVL